MLERYAVNDLMFLGAVMASLLALVYPWALLLAMAVLVGPLVFPMVAEKVRKTQEQQKEKAGKGVWRSRMLWDAVFGKKEEKQKEADWRDRLRSRTGSNASAASSSGGAGAGAAAATGGSLSPQRESAAAAASARAGGEATGGEVHDDDEEDLLPPPPLDVAEVWGMPQLRMMGFGERRVLKINPDVPVPIENEFFTGRLLFMVRTEQAEYNRYAQHFEGRQRRFEMQIQGVFKKAPSGRFYMGGELKKNVTLPLITRALVSFVMKFCSRLIANMHFAFGEEPSNNETHERSHVVFPLFQAMDHIIETPPGEEPPTLGVELPEPLAERKARRAGKIPDIEWKLGYTYSFSFHSMYLDFAEWTIVKIPGQRPIDLRSIIGDQHLTFTVYELNEEASIANGNRHERRHINPFFCVDVGHLCIIPEEELEEERDRHQREAHEQFMAARAARAQRRARRGLPASGGDGQRSRVRGAAVAAGVVGGAAASPSGAGSDGLQGQQHQRLQQLQHRMDNASSDSPAPAMALSGMSPASEREDGNIINSGAADVLTPVVEPRLGHLLVANSIVYLVVGESGQLTACASPPQSPTSAPPTRSSGWGFLRSGKKNKAKQDGSGKSRRESTGAITSSGRRPASAGSVLSTSASEERDRSVRSRGGGGGGGDDDYDDDDDDEGQGQPELSPEGPSGLDVRTAMGAAGGGGENAEGSGANRRAQSAGAEPENTSATRAGRSDSETDLDVDTSYMGADDDMGKPRSGSEGAGDQPPAQAWLSIASDGGFAVLVHTTNPTALTLTKVRAYSAGRSGNKSSASSGANSGDMSTDEDRPLPANVLRYGDSVTVQDSRTGKVLSIYRGWWLCWRAPGYRTSKSAFVLRPLTQSQRLGDPIRVGEGPTFRLASAKWAKYELGVYVTPTTSTAGSGSAGSSGNSGAVATGDVGGDNTHDERGAEQQHGAAVNSAARVSSGDSGAAPSAARLLAMFYYSKKDPPSGTFRWKNGTQIHAISFAARSAQREDRSGQDDSDDLQARQLVRAISSGIRSEDSPSGRGRGAARGAGAADESAEATTENNEQALYGEVVDGDESFKARSRSEDDSLDESPGLHGGVNIPPEQWLRRVQSLQVEVPAYIELFHRTFKRKQLAYMVVSTAAVEDEASPLLAEASGTQLDRSDSHTSADGSSQVCMWSRLRTGKGMRDMVDELPSTGPTGVVTPQTLRSSGLPPELVWSRGDAAGSANGRSRPGSAGHAAHQTSGYDRNDRRAPTSSPKRDCSRKLGLFAGGESVKPMKKAAAAANGADDYGSAQPTSVARRRSKSVGDIDDSRGTMEASKGNMLGGEEGDESLLSAADQDADERDADEQDADEQDADEQDSEGDTKAIDDDEDDQDREDDDDEEDDDDDAEEIGGVRDRDGGIPFRARRESVVRGLQPLQHQNTADQSIRLLSKRIQQSLVCELHPFQDASIQVATDSRDRPGSASAQGGMVRVDEATGRRTWWPGSLADVRAAFPARHALLAALQRADILDTWFLRGGPNELMVSLPSRVRPLLRTVVARCLWETHWREELVALFPSHIAFFPPLSRKPAFILPMHDVMSVGATRERPFPAFHFAYVETLGRVHYMAFARESDRNKWVEKLNSLIGTMTEVPYGILVTDPRESYVMKGGPWRPLNRVILNGRLMRFDTPHQDITPCELSIFLCKLVFALSPDSGRDPLKSFLDMTAMLKHVDLVMLEKGSNEAFCFYVNVYHTLLQHARLVVGLPSSPNWGLFFSSVSYEIGNDVFSLAELEHCVIRGDMSRPRMLPRPFHALPPEEDDHYHYALGRRDPRVNFTLNNGATTGTPNVFLMRPQGLNHRINCACEDVLRHTIKVDVRKRLISLPRVCDMYMEDFSGPTECVTFCQRFLDPDQKQKVAMLLDSGRSFTVKYRSWKAQSQRTLQLRDEAPPPRDMDSPSGSASEEDSFTRKRAEES